MKKMFTILMVGAILSTLTGCKKDESQQTTPPPSSDQLGTGQQFGYPSQSNTTK